MKTKLLVIGVGLCLLTSFCRAGIIGVNYADDGDGAFVCAADTWSGDPATEITLNVDGVQYGEVGHIVGEITTDAPNDDPTLSIANSIDNELDFAWTAYSVNVYMSSPFAIQNVYVSLPNDWTVESVIQPVLSGSEYMGQIQYSSGTPVAIGQTLDFGYSIVFDGYTNFRFCQEMTAIPEPASAGLIALVCGGGLFVRKRFVMS